VHFRTLRSGIEVSRIGLGCGGFGGIGSAPAFFGQGETREQSFALLDAARELGITLLDTADAYGGGRSERWIGEWLRERGAEGVVVATKVFHSVEGEAGDYGLAPERIRRQVEGSLERLGVERIDLYLAHEPDPATPLVDTLTVLDGLVREGTVRAVGASNVGAPWIEDALTIAAERGLAPIEVVQNAYSLLNRTAEREVLPLCARHGIAFTAFGPLEGGWLTGKYRRGQTVPTGSRMTLRPEPYARLERESTFAALDALEAAALRRDIDLPTLAFAWLLADERVTSVVAGPRRVEHLQPASRALELALSPADRDELSTLVPRTTVAPQ
jgi:aryl-alcohol dehydrogenase-like predicted oxidoreductase